MFDGLNVLQQRAATAGEGPVLIVAGPGTGKTKTLTARIAHLVASKQAPANRILALTFTKKAAEEMRQRLGDLVKTNVPNVLTFHALCHKLLGNDTPFIGDAARLWLIKSLSRPKGLKELSTRELALAISRAKNQPAISDPTLAKMVRAYNQRLSQQSLQDFDDLLQNAYLKLRDDADFRNEVQQRFSHVLVDEFQDTNLLQYELLKLLLGHQNVLVIGDPNQSIYGFRGASGNIFEQFKADFPDYTEITLTANYRSAPEIVKLSNAIFPDQLALKAQDKQRGQVRAVQVLNEYGEAEWVLGEIQKAIGGGDFLRAVSDDERTSHQSLRDFAVLYRSRSAAIALQKAVDQSGLPYQIVGDGSPYEKPQVQTVIAVFRALQTSEPIESDNSRKAAELLQKHKDLLPVTLAEKIIDTLGLEPSRELPQFLATLVRFNTTQEVLDYLDHIAQTGFYDPNVEAITLLTIHASKGLEFPCVFLIGAEEGILPSKRGEKAEERRLFYVAATRAKERLEITHAKNRGGQPAQVSSFLTELPKDVLRQVVDPDMQAQARRITKRQIKRSQQSLF